MKIVITLESDNLKEIYDTAWGVHNIFVDQEDYTDSNVLLNFNSSKENKEVSLYVNVDNCSSAYYLPKSTYHLLQEAVKLCIDNIFNVVEEPSVLQKWAEKEVEFACINERKTPEALEGEWDYGCSCYESALKAFNSLLKDNHSGFSIGMTKHILNRLIDDKPLTPIYDVDDVWVWVAGAASGDNDEEQPMRYQCKRRGSLFKYIYADGSVKYRDIDSYYCVDINTGTTYHSGLVGKVIDELFPITMPYMPGESIKVYCEDILTDCKNGDYDTTAIFYALKSNCERIEINRFFKEASFNFTQFDRPHIHGWEEIDVEEYKKRKELSIKRAVSDRSFVEVGEDKEVRNEKMPHIKKRKRPSP